MRCTRHRAGSMWSVRWEQYPTEKSSRTTPIMTCAHSGTPRLTISAAGRIENVSAARATDEASAQLKRNDNAVSPRFARRRSRFQGAAANMGTAVSSSAASAMTERTTVRFVRKSRVLIVCPPALVMLERDRIVESDKYLTSLSASASGRTRRSRRSLRYDRARAGRALAVRRGRRAVHQRDRLHDHDRWF